MMIIGPVSKDVQATPNQHILVNFDGAFHGDIVENDVRVILPPVNALSYRTTVRVSELSADGGRGAGKALRIVGQFAPLVGGNYAESGYIVANVGTDAGPNSNLSRRGAFIELYCLAANAPHVGWVIVAEGCQPMAPLA